MTQANVDNETLIFVLVIGSWSRAWASSSQTLANLPKDDEMLLNVETSRFHPFHEGKQFQLKWPWRVHVLSLSYLGLNLLAKWMAVNDFLSLKDLKYEKQDNYQITWHWSICLIHSFLIRELMWKKAIKLTGDYECSRLK